MKNISFIVRCDQEHLNTWMVKRSLWFRKLQQNVYCLMIAEANMERCMIWDLSQLPVETVAVRSLKLTGVGKEVTFFSRFNWLCSFSLYELLSLYRSLSLSASKNPLHTSPESTWAFRKGHIYTLSQTHKRHTHQLQLSSPAYSGVTTASSSFSCGNSLITDGWEWIWPNTIRFATEKYQSI